MTILFLSGFTIFTFVHAIVNRNNDKAQDHGVIKTAYEGIKKKKWTIYFTSYFLLRWVLIVIAVILFQGTDVVVRLIIFTAIQIFSIGLFMLWKPLVPRTQAILDWVNDCVFVLICGILLGYNEKWDWSSSKENGVTWILIVVSIICSIVGLVDSVMNLVFTIWDYIKKRKD